MVIPALLLLSTGKTVGPDLIPCSPSAQSSDEGKPFQEFTQRPYFTRSKAGMPKACTAASDVLGQVLAISYEAATSWRPRPSHRGEEPSSSQETDSFTASTRRPYEVLESCKLESSVPLVHHHDPSPLCPRRPRGSFHVRSPHRHSADPFVFVSLWSPAGEICLQPLARRCMWLLL